MKPTRVGPYTVEAELGRGGMGAVYRARHPSGRPVAVKVLLAGSEDAEDLERFRREAALAQGLDHPNLVPVRDAGAAGGRPYLVTDLVDGESLGARLRREGPLPAHEAARIAERVARGLEHAHTRGVWHRDVKPDNVLLGGDEGAEPRLVDFGLAVAPGRHQRLTASGVVVGTPNFMAPEQATGRRGALGPATDVYGLGATLYQMLTGRPPFEGSSNLAVLQAVVERPPDRPSRLRSDVDAELERICLRCLAKSPAERYPSAGALAMALAGYLAGGRPRPTPRPKRIALAVALGGAAVAAAILATGLLVGDGAGARERASSPSPASSADDDREGAAEASEGAAGDADGADGAPTRPTPAPSTRAPPDPRPLRRLPSGDGGAAPHPGGVTAVAFGPDGELVASAGAAGRVRTWRQEDGARRLDVELAAPAGALAFVASELLAAGTEEGRVVLFGLDGGPEALPVSHGGPTAVAAWPEERRLASAGPDDTLVVWDAASREVLGRVAPAGQGGVVALAAWEDVVLSGGADGSVRAWRVASGQLEPLELTWRAGGDLHEVTHPAPVREGESLPEVYGLTASSQGRIVVATAGGASLWELEPVSAAGLRADLLQGTRDLVPRCGVPTSWGAVAAAARDGSFSLVAVDGRVREVTTHADAVVALAAGPADRFVVSGARDGSVAVSDLERGTTAWQRGGDGVEASVVGLVPRSEGGYLGATAEGVVRPWRPRTGWTSAVARTPAGICAFTTGPRPGSFAVGHTGEGGATDVSVLHPDRERGRAVGRVPAPPGWIACSRRFLVAGGLDDGAARLWPLDGEANASAVLRPAPPDAVAVRALPGDEGLRWVEAYPDGRLHFVADGEEPVARSSSVGPVTALWRTPGERFLLAGGPEGVEAWEPATATSRAVLRAPGGPAALAASRGARVGAVDPSGAVRVWSAQDPAEVARGTLPAGRGAARCLTFAPDGRELYVGTTTGDVVRYAVPE